MSLKNVKNKSLLLAVIIFLIPFVGLIQDTEAKFVVQETNAIYLPIIFKEYSPQPPPEVCDRAFFVGDVTIPDGTVLTPETKFVKTWRLRNDGFCTWDTDYDIVFVSGNLMLGPAIQQISTLPILPGQTVDISVMFTAPSQAGTYQGIWKLRNELGILFGIGETNESFHILIDVIQ